MKNTAQKQNKNKTVKIKKTGTVKTGTLEEARILTPKIIMDTADKIESEIAKVTDTVVIEETINIDVKEADDFTVETLYIKGNLGSKRLEELNEQELMIVSRYGQIVAQKREKSEVQGKSAEVQIVKKQIGDLESKYAIASLAEKALKETEMALKNHREPEIPIEIVIRLAGKEVVVSQKILKELSPSGQNLQTVFASSVGQVCSAAKQAIMTQVSTLNNGNGKRYDIPFNFQPVEADIKNEYLANKTTEQ
jgi:hypothetical protein